MNNEELMKLIDSISVVFPKRLKHFREQAGLTLREVAEKIGKSPSQISLWERGINPPSCIDLFKLCLIYNIIFPDLFPEVSNKIQPIKEELELIKKYRAADPEAKITIYKILEYTQKGQGK